MKKTFVTIFEKLQNVHLTKDVGQIPYFMHSKFGYHAKLVGHRFDEEYPYLYTEVKGLDLVLLPKLKIGRISVSIIFYILSNAKKIDVLNLYHHATKTYFYIWLYKLLNPKGIVYLKSDIVAIGLNEYKSFVNPKYKIRNYFFNRVIPDIDIISMETKYTFDMINGIYSKYKDKFLYLPNGLNIDAAYRYTKPKDYMNKENIIITVGRLGTHQKNNEVLLEAISKIDLQDWTVYMIGTVETKFNNYINEYYTKFPHLRHKVIFTGNIEDKKQLYHFYNRSKIFCLTSRDESFGLVYVEALAYGNFILSTDVGAIHDITDNQKYGKIINGSDDLSVELVNIINNDLLSKHYQDSIDFAQKKFNWFNIIDTLERQIKHVRKKD